jgi:hypothetical protein
MLKKNLIALAGIAPDNCTQNQIQAVIRSLCPSPESIIGFDTSSGGNSGWQEATRVLQGGSKERPGDVDCGRRDQRKPLECVKTGKQGGS